MPDVYPQPNPLVIIVNHQRPKDTIECIQSLQASKTVQADVLVVDNGSPDRSAEQITAALPDVEILRLKDNLGFAGGYNAGIRHGLANRSASEFFLLNNDTIIDPLAMDALARSSWDVAVPKILYHQEPGLIWAAGAVWRSFPPAVIMHGYRKPDGPRYDRARRLDYATGCALWVKRPVLESVGGFDERFVNYMEDYDFAYRVRAAGYQIGYVPGARVYHKVAQTLGVQSAERWRYLGRNTVLFYRLEERFPIWKLWSFLSWVTLRETLKGQAAYLPHYWQGVREGVSRLAEWEENGNRRL